MHTQHFWMAHTLYICMVVKCHTNWEQYCLGTKHLFWFSLPCSPSSARGSSYAWIPSYCEGGDICRQGVRGHIEKKVNVMADLSRFLGKLSVVVTQKQVVTQLFYYTYIFIPTCHKRSNQKNQSEYKWSAALLYNII